MPLVQFNNPNEIQLRCKRSDFMEHLSVDSEQWYIDTETYSDFLIGLVAKAQYDGVFPPHVNARILRGPYISEADVAKFYLYCSHIGCKTKIDAVSDLNDLNGAEHAKFRFVFSQPQCVHVPFKLAPKPVQNKNKSNDAVKSDFDCKFIEHARQSLQPSIKPVHTAAQEAIQMKGSDIVYGSAVSGRLDKWYHYNNSRSNDESAETELNWLRVNNELLQLAKQGVSQDSKMFNLPINNVTSRYLGYVHRLQSLHPFSVDIYDMASFKMYQYFGNDLFVDFTGSLVTEVENTKLYNFAIAVAAPQGGTAPVTVMETVCESMSGHMVRCAMSEWGYNFEQVIGKPMGSCHDVIYVHSDMFKGIAHGVCEALNNCTLHKFLLSKFEIIKGVSAVDSYKFIPDWCYSHLMCKVAFHETKFVNNVADDVIHDWKVARMATFRGMKCALNTRSALLFINCFRIISSVESFNFVDTTANKFDFISIEDLEPDQEESNFAAFEYELMNDKPNWTRLNKSAFDTNINVDAHNVDDDKISEDEIDESDEIAARKIYDWKNASDAKTYSARNAPNPYRSSNDILVITPHPEKLPELQIWYDKISKSATVVPCHVPIKTKADSLACVKNLYVSTNDWKWFLYNYGTYYPLWNDMIVGGSMWRNNVHCELIFRSKKKDKKCLASNTTRSVPDYVKFTNMRNKAQQRMFYSRISTIYSDWKMETSGWIDQWSQRRTTTARIAYTSFSKSCCQSWTLIINQKNWSAIPMKHKHKQINSIFQKWKSTHTNPIVKSSSRTISKQTIERLQNNKELPNFNIQTQNMYRYFLDDVSKGWNY